MKVDFKNAFNSHLRQPMLLAVHEHVPELYRLASYAYGRPTPLFFGDHRVESASGCQQGDPAAPLLFSLVLQPLLLRLKSNLVVAYLDDLTLSDPDPSVLADDLRTIREASLSIGLEMNFSKCEMFHQGYPLGAEPDLSAELPGSRECNRVNLELLGAAIFRDGNSRLIENLDHRLTKMHSRLPLLSSQSAYFLLRNSLGIQRVTYFLRSSPAFMCLDHLKNLDSTLLRCAESCLNMALDRTSEQMRLPVRAGGLGLRHPSDLALPCFLSSAHACEEIVHEAVGPTTEVALLSTASVAWCARYDDTPEDDEKCLQQAWDKISVAKAQSLLRSSLDDDAAARIRMEHAAGPQSGAWLHVRPDENLGTVLQDSEFRVACSLRLGLDLFCSHLCSCGETADAKGYHKLSCKNGAVYREARHNAVNDVLTRAIRQLGIAVRVEPQHLHSNDEIRPDGVTLTPWSVGKSLVWDVSIRNTFAASYAGLARTVGGVAAKAERDKCAHYEALVEEGGYIMKPFVTETSGVWGKEALLLSKEVGDRLRLATGEKRSVEFLRQRVALEVQRGSAQMILRTLPAGRGFGEMFYL